MDVYTTDCNHAKVRLLHKLNDEHVIPEKIKKMKVCIHLSTPDKNKNPEAIVLVIHKHKGQLYKTMDHIQCNYKYNSTFHA